MTFFKSYDDKIKEQEEKQRVYKQKQQDQLKVIEDKAKLAEETRNTNKMFSIMKKTKPRHKAWTNRIKDHFFGTKTMLIHMELINGFHTQFIVIINKGSFKYGGGTYIIDDELKYYDMAAKLWCLNYHESLPVPIKNKIDITTIKKAVVSSGISNVDTAFNPLTLKQFIESEVIQKVMQGQEMEKVFKFLKFMLILSVIFSGISMLILIKSTGMLDNMRLPF